MLSKLFILSVIVVAVICHKPGGGHGKHGGAEGRDHHGGHGKHHGCPGPFLKNVTEEARKAYFAIVHNEKLTLAQIDSQSAAWASANGVAALYNEVQANRSAHEAELKKNVSAAIGNLSDVQAKLNAIFENKDQTKAQVHQAIEDLKQASPLEVKMLLSAGHGDHGKHGGRHGGPGRHGKHHGGSGRHVGKGQYGNDEPEDSDDLDVEDEEL